MNKFRLLQSFELFSFFIKNSQEIAKSPVDSLNKIAELLNTSFDCKDFEEVVLLANNQQSLQNENLFIDFTHLNFRYLNLNILSRKETVIIYTCILGWMKNLDIDIDRTLLNRVLNVDNELQQMLAGFLSDQTDALTLAGHELFLLEPDTTKRDELEGRWIDTNKPENIILENQFIITGIASPIKVLYISDLKIFLLLPRNKKLSFKKNGLSSPCSWEDMQPGDSIELGEEFSIDYYDLKNRYLHHTWSKKLWMGIQNIAFTYPNGKGIKEFSINIESGWLIGIIGHEGCGKSTLLKILAGVLNYTRGEIIVNGYNLRNNLYQLKNMIGFVSDEDLLYDELTVYENLYLTAKLYLGNVPQEEIVFRVNKLLKDLELDHLRKTIVGSLADKYLQPGQRRLLNIALELIRDPHILIVDNSLALLSSGDSSMIIEVLANYSHNDKIVITSITQTYRNSFLNFDRIFILDDGGFPIYFGKTLDCKKYFAELFSIPPPQGNIADADEMLQLINSKSLTKTFSSQERYKTPLELYQQFISEDQNKPVQNRRWRSLPENLIHTPTLDRQYAIYNLRNIKIKIARTRELIYALLASPILAVIVSTFLREGTADGYSFNTNEHIPGFYFISMILALLLGLILSANEIFKERSITRKQKYLNLSQFSYINAKITFLLFICFIQSLLYVGISVYILEIRSSWIIFASLFFSSQAFGVLLGLFFSATHGSLEIMYTRSLPLVLILQLLFGGGFTDLSSYGSKSDNYTPLLSDLMVVRWGYECIMVDQFVRNPYMQHFYTFEKEKTQCEFYADNLLPVLQEMTANSLLADQNNPGHLQRSLRVITEYLELIPANFDAFPYENINRLNNKEYNPEIQADLLEYIEYLKIYFASRNTKYTQNEEELVKTLNDSLGGLYLETLYKNYYNIAIASKVTRSEVSNPIRYFNEKPLQDKNNIYQSPVSIFGRTPIFLPEKQFADQKINTVEFNLSIMWLFNLLLYVVLVSGLPGKIADRN
jgi:ABC-type multidrug transport system ATPase subunit